MSLILTRFTQIWVYMNSYGIRRIISTCLNIHTVIIKEIRVDWRISRFSKCKIFVFFDNILIFWDFEEKYAKYMNIMKNIPKWQLKFNKLMKTLKNIPKRQLKSTYRWKSRKYTKMTVKINKSMKLIKKTPKWQFKSINMWKLWKRHTNNNENR